MATISRLTVFNLEATRISQEPEQKYEALDNFIQVAKETGIVPQGMIENLEKHLPATENVFPVILSSHEIETLQTCLDDTFLGYIGVVVDEDGLDYDDDGDSCKMYDPDEVLRRLFASVAKTLVFNGEVQIMCDENLKSSRKLLVKDSKIENYQPADIVWEKIS